MAFLERSPRSLRSAKQVGSVCRHLAAHPDAVVVELGAGLSTRYYWVGERCCCWLELDLPEVTALRRHFDTESDRHLFLGASVLDFGWLDAVPAVAGRVLFLAEGLLMYLEADRVRALVTQLERRFPGATFALEAVGGVTRGPTAKALAMLEMRP